MKWLKAIAVVCVAASSLWAASVDLNTTGAGGTGTSGGGAADGTGNWTASGSSSTYLMGNTGIGTTAPTTKLTIKTADIEGDGLDILRDNDSIMAKIGYKVANTSGFLELYNSAAFPNVRFNANGASWFAANGTGSYGIGTSTPVATLHVSGAAGETGHALIVATGTATLFKVAGTSVVLRVPLYTDNDITAGYFRGNGSLLTGIVGGGASTLAVASGTTTGFGVPTSSPTVILNFNKDQFNVTLPAGNTTFVTIKPEIDLTMSSGTVTGSGFRIVGSTIGVVLGKLGLGTFAPSYLLHITTTAGTTSTLMTVSTGPIDLFKVNGTSVAMRVPLWMNNNDIQDVGTIGGGAVSGNFVISDTLHSSMSFVTSGGTVTLTANGVRTMAATGLFGNTSNANALVISATMTKVNANLGSTGTITASNISLDPVLFEIDLSSDTLAAGCTIWMGDAPSYSAVTITKVIAKTYSVAASTANYSLQEKTVQSANGAQIFTGTYSSGTWNHGNPITSFADSSIAAGSGLYFVTKDGGSMAGTPRHLSVKVYGKYATP